MKSLSTPKIVGSLMVVSLLMGMYNNLALLSPNVFHANFLTLLSQNSHKVLLSIFISLLLNIGSIVIAIMLYEPFKMHHKNLTKFYFVACIIKFTWNVIDKTMVVILLSISNLHLNADEKSKTVYANMGKAIQHSAENTHLMDILFGFVALYLLFLLFFRTKFINSIIGLIGIIATLLGMTEMVMNLFGIHHSFHIFMLLPTALLQLIIGIILILKGFSKNTKYTNV